MAQPEHSAEKREHGIEGAREASAERSAELLKMHERSGEVDRDNEVRAKNERKNIEALFEKESSGEHKHAHMDDESPSERKKHVTKTEREDSYKKTMYEVRRHMSPSSKTFSKFIHHPVVEKTSDAIGNTVARPNALLAGSLAAFILVAIVYVVARTMGYRLSGFETIGAFIIGWLIGIAYDFVRTMMRGSSS